MKLQHNPRSTITVWIIHVLCWLFFFTLPLLFRPEPNPNHNNNLPEWLGIPFPMFFNNLFLLLAFYANLLWAMPHFFKKDRWFLYAAITLVFLLFSYWIHPLTRALESIFFDTVGLVDMGLGRPPEGRFEFRQFSFLYTFAMIWSLSMVYYLLQQLQRSKKESQEIRATALQSELFYLKAQIHPHFIYNTLNNIYLLSLKKSDKAPQALLQLSNLMRRLTAESNQEKIALTEEVSFLMDYVELQKMRLTGKTTVQFEVSGNMEAYSIAPRILMPYIENAFKYGASGHKASNIVLLLEIEHDQLHLLCQNHIFRIPSDLSARSAGTGLENNRRRLDLLYKNNYRLNIETKNESYVVNLQLNLI